MLRRKRAITNKAVEEKSNFSRLDFEVPKEPAARVPTITPIPMDVAQMRRSAKGRSYTWANHDTAQRACKERRAPINMLQIRAIERTTGDVKTKTPVSLRFCSKLFCAFPFLQKIGSSFLFKKRDKARTTQKKLRKAKTNDIPHESMAQPRGATPTTAPKFPTANVNPE
ncbi:hypothetical protein SDC9_164424 [bioreactor metagenome]|uniref:Uncharacterized protein n=1 Tax=bioreactor metagenome TaxID=1076179 RepID=A0A645FYX6_9ZZZZ